MLLARKGFSLLYFFRPFLTAHLDSVEIGLLVEEEIDDEISTLGMVEEDEEAPVDEPGPLLQGLQVAAEGALVDELLQPVEVLERGVPVLHQDLGSELAPHAVQIVLVRGLNKAWIIMELYFYQRIFGDPFRTGKLKISVSAANSQEISIYFNKYLLGQNKYFLAYFWVENKYILA